MDKKEYFEIVEQIQKECHGLSQAMMEQHPDFFKGGKTQDITNVFFFKKLADIELRLRELEAVFSSKQ